MSISVAYMPDDTTEGAPIYYLGCNHQSTCMPQSQPLFYVQLLVPNVLSRRDEGSGKPCAVGQAIVNHLGIDPGTSGSTFPSCNHCTTTAHGEIIVTQWQERRFHPKIFGNMWDGRNRSMNQMHDRVATEQDFSGMEASLWLNEMS